MTIFAITQLAVMYYLNFNTVGLNNRGFIKLNYQNLIFTRY